MEATTLQRQYTLAEYVEHMATAKGLRRSQIAEHLNMSPATLSQYISGTRSPSEESRHRIVVLTGGAVTFDVPADRTPDASAGS